MPFRFKGLKQNILQSFEVLHESILFIPRCNFLAKILTFQEITITLTGAKFYISYH